MTVIYVSKSLSRIDTPDVLRSLQSVFFFFIIQRCHNAAFAKVFYHPAALLYTPNSETRVDVEYVLQSRLQGDTKKVFHDDQWLMFY